VYILSSGKKTFLDHVKPKPWFLQILKTCFTSITDLKNLFHEHSQLSICRCIISTGWEPRSPTINVECVVTAGKYTKKSKSPA